MQESARPLRFDGTVPNSHQKHGRSHCIARYVYIHIEVLVGFVEVVNVHEGKPLQRRRRSGAQAFLAPNWAAQRGACVAQVAK